MSAPRRPARQKAGASAQNMADRTRKTQIREQHRRARWILPPTAAALGAAGWFIYQATGLWQAGAAPALAVMVTVVLRLYRNTGSTWQTGALGERRTGRILAPLEFFGFGRWAVLHDRQIPRSSANLDHLIFGPTGATYVDTKTWRSARAKVTVDRHGELWYGRWPQRETLETALWEAGRASQALGGVPVRTVIAVHFAHVPAAGLHSAGVEIIPAAQLRRHLRNLPRQAGWDRTAVREMRRRADALLPPYVG
ncbi:nuclease-related domain-containing protein [Streptacidiphilus sp. EB103A]|uniref:nuclease-related domain-containing protein n=1 Tax=Streptacidiphilus sp. EB103A TaxID=3156275 RepID=UPI003513D722